MYLPNINATGGDFMNDNNRRLLEQKQQSNKYDALIELCRSAERILITIIDKAIK